LGFSSQLFHYKKTNFLKDRRESGAALGGGGGGAGGAGGAGGSAGPVSLAA